jgi:hypothetical protein
VREIDDLPATVWWGVQVSSIQSAHCTVHCTRAGILCSSVIGISETSTPIKLFDTDINIPISIPNCTSVYIPSEGLCNDA